MIEKNTQDLSIGKSVLFLSLIAPETFFCHSIHSTSLPQLPLTKIYKTDKNFINLLHKTDYHVMPDFTPFPLLDQSCPAKFIRGLHGNPYFEQISFLNTLIAGKVDHGTRGSSEPTKPENYSWPVNFILCSQQHGNQFTKVICIRTDTFVDDKI